MPVYALENGATVTYYEGFIIDLVAHLSRLLKFDYILSLVPDGEYGHRRPDGSWDGLIGEVTNRVSGLQSGFIGHDLIYHKEMGNSWSNCVGFWYWRLS